MFGLSSTIIQNILIILGPTAVILFVYLKGQSAGKKSAAEEQAEAQRVLDAHARAAEAKNQFLEKERYEYVEKARDASGTPSAAIGVWNEGPWGPKDPDSSSGKKSD